jgi:hypothetical protein
MVYIWYLSKLYLTYYCYYYYYYMYTHDMCLVYCSQDCLATIPRGGVPPYLL